MLRHGRGFKGNSLLAPRTRRSASLLTMEGIDLRDPRWSVTPDGRLMLCVGSFRWFDEA